MSARASVGFIAISNHVLDAAKSNRCVCLLRAEPDRSELCDISNGCLFDTHERSKRAKLVSGLPAGIEVTIGSLIDQLCQTYTELTNDEGRFDWFKHFFGLRDFIHALKYLRRTALSAERDGSRIAADHVVCALERNFNGVEPAKFEAVVRVFLENIFGKPVADARTERLRKPIEVLREALADTKGGAQMDVNAPR